MVLKNGVANALTFVFTNADNTPATGLSGSFYVVDADLHPDTGAKIGGTTFAFASTATPGTYTGTFPYSASILLDVKRKYRVVPLIANVFRGDDQIFSVAYA
jgi:hypothetical protein